MTAFVKPFRVIYFSTEATKNGTYGCAYVRMPRKICVQTDMRSGRKPAFGQSLQTGSPISHPT